MLSASTESSNGGRPNTIVTGAPAAWVRSASIRERTVSASAKRLALNEFRYSLSDLDSTRCGESAGTRSVAVATCGLPRGSSHDSS